MKIEVCYALPQKQEIVAVELGEHATLSDAVMASGLMTKYPDITLEQSKFGVFGKICRVDSPLSEGDRVEIYRPLIADPKEVRRKRAEEGKAMKKGGGEL
jgi:putative ubiquitin-RnfH superfamily antitoxin RatB of RatAB toxin-antitoxin module